MSSRVLPVLSRMTIEIDGKREEEQKLRATREKHKYLYPLIKRQKGRVTLLEYALELEMGTEEARAYLESRATVPSLALLLL
jgi:hypothetical protein